MVDEAGGDANIGGDKGDGRLEALEAKMSGVTESVGKLVDMIGALQPKDKEAEPSAADPDDDLKDQPIEKRIESLATTVQVLAGAVNKIVTERNTEQQAAAAAAAAARDAVIDQVVKALPEFEKNREQLKNVPMSVLEMMLKRQSNKTPDPMAPVSTKVKPLSLDEASKIAAERKKSQQEKLLSMSAFGRL